MCTIGGVKNMGFPFTMMCTAMPKEGLDRCGRFVAVKANQHAVAHE